MKQRILGSLMALMLVVGMGVTAVQAQTTSALNSTQIGAIISLLTAFGADQSVITSVEAALGETVSVNTGSSFCYNWNTNLGVGSSGADVTALYQALSLNSGKNVAGSDNTSIFSEDTAASVVQFQTRYNITPTGYVGSLTRGELNSLYGCSTQPTQPVTPPPTSMPFTVTFPTLGSTLQLGQTYNLTWTGTDSSNPNGLDYQIYLVGGALGNTGTLYIGDIPATQQSFSWTVPTSIQPANNYQIEFGANVKGGAGGNSQNFGISYAGTKGPGTTSSITMTSPVGNVSWQQDTLGSWTWTSSGSVPSVDVYLQIGTTYYPFASSYPNSGSFQWNVGNVMGTWRGVSSIPNGTYIIAVCPAGDYISTANCGEFNATISGNTPSVSIVSPTGGQTFQVGGPFNVTFAAPSQGDQYQINLFANVRGSTEYTLGNVIGINGSQQTASFTIPSSIPAGSYTVQVAQLTNQGSSCTNFACAQATSNSFTITSGSSNTNQPIVSSVAGPGTQGLGSGEIIIYGQNLVPAGLVQVFVDNTRIFTVSTGGLSNNAGSFLVATPNLANGQHTLYVTNSLGTSNTISFQYNSPIVSSTASSTQTYNNGYFSFNYPTGWNVSTNSAGVISLTTGNQSDGTITLTQINTLPATDPSGKWGNINYSWQNGQWVVTTSNNSNPTAAQPLFTNPYGLPVFIGIIPTTGWGQYDYMMPIYNLFGSTATSPMILVSGPDSQSNPTTSAVVTQIINSIAPLKG